MRWVYMAGRETAEVRMLPPERKHEGQLPRKQTTFFA